MDLGPGQLLGPNKAHIMGTGKAFPSHPRFLRPVDLRDYVGFMVVNNPLDKALISWGVALVAIRGWPRLDSDERSATGARHRRTFGTF